MRKSLHDYEIASYEVRCRTREIIIHAEYCYPDEPLVCAKALFREVATYRFWDDAFGNIIFDIEEVPVARIIHEYGAEIAESLRMSGAADEWARELTSAPAKLEAGGVHGFILTSSIGLSAWILAKEYCVEDE